MPRESQIEEVRYELADAVRISVLPIEKWDAEIAAIPEASRGSVARTAAHLRKTRIAYRTCKRRRDTRPGE
jgi:hypothetical protein